jgi:uncharacterized protein
MGTTEKTNLKESPEANSNLDQSVEDVLKDAASSGEQAYGLRVSADGISLLLDCPDPLGDLEATVQRIQNDFREMELPEFPDSEILSEILKKSCEPGEFLVSFTIMKGWGPTSSQNGRLEWQRDFFGEDSDSEDESEVHDFWDQNDQQSVKQDELLARVYHAIAGEPGLDVFSREIPVTKPTSVKLRSGKGVRQIDEGDWLAYYADNAGRIRYQDDTLVVDDVYIIKGDVSLETGNIQHTGTVHVEGDVKTGATIEADGDIMVKGMMDPCHMKCGGSLTVLGGIVGQDDFLIEVQGNLKAMYIGAAVIRCGGDVMVGNEIAHADIKAYGKVLVPTGRIAGGQVIGREGIQTAEAGGSGSTSTLLVVGVDFTVEGRNAEREARIAKLEDAQDKIQEALTKAGLSIDPSSQEEHPQLTELSAKSKLIGETIIKEHAAIRADLQKSKLASSEEVIMLREVWSGTTIQIGDAKTVVRASIEKPRVARLNKDKVSILPLGDGNMPKK